MKPGREAYRGNQHGCVKAHLQVYGRLRPPPSLDGGGYTACLEHWRFCYGPCRAGDLAAEPELYPSSGGLALSPWGLCPRPTGAARLAV